MKLEVTDLSADAVAEVARLAENSPYGAYRNYRIMSRKAQAAVVCDNLLARDTDVLARRMVAGKHGDLRAAGAVVQNSWETDFFGVSMAKLQAILHEEDCPEVLELLVDDLIKGARDSGVEHLAARIDAADLSLISLLESLGFRTMDVIATYAYHPRRPTPEPVREMGRLRDYRPDDRQQVLELATDAYRGFRGRYHCDPGLPSKRADEVYVEWARLSCEGIWAEKVFVTEGGDGSIIGFAAFRRNEPVSSHGRIAVYGGGLGACRKDRPGAYRGLLQAAARWIHGHKALTECQTQAFNFPAIRLYESLGQNLVRIELTLHMWLR